MLTAEFIKKKAAELGADLCGIGSLELFEGENPQRDPKMILPAAKCIIGFGFAVPRGLYMTMDIGSQYYTYTSMWLLCPWNSPGKNTGVGSHSLLQGIVSTHRWNLGLPHCWQILYHLSQYSNVK